MKILWTILVFFLIVVPVGMADFQEILDRVDQLHEAEDYEQTRSYIESSMSQAASGAEKAELHWRLARA